MRNAISYLMVLAIFNVGWAAAQGQQSDEQASEKPRQSAQQFSANVQVDLSYLLYLPDDYESKESWPLLLFLHGAGERGDDVATWATHDRSGQELSR